MPRSDTTAASRVILGLGGCVDYELKLTAHVLEKLITEYGIVAAELTSPPISPVTGPTVTGSTTSGLTASGPTSGGSTVGGSTVGGSTVGGSTVGGSTVGGSTVGRGSTVGGERDLVVSILGYVARGGGGEHFVTAAPVLQRFADRFRHRATLGGTSVRAGVLMSRLGIPSTLHLVTVNDTVRRLLPPDCDYVDSGAEDTFYPHLIVQYDQGLRIRAGDLDITAPFPNRLIYVNDPANSDMRLTDDLGDRLGQAAIFLISGFNAMRSAAELDERLAALKKHMRHLPAGAVTYFEDAAYHEPSFSRRVRDALINTINVYGLNEDELQSYLGHAVNLLSPAQVAEALVAVHTLIPVPTLVLHTKYWAGHYGAGYGDALDTGVVMAATRYRHGDDFTDEDVERLRRQPRRPESVAFAAALRERMGDTVDCVPAFELDVVHPTTVGLGDTFVGGFLAALARNASSRPAHYPQTD